MKLSVPAPADEAAVMEFRQAFLQNSELLLGAGGLENYDHYADWLSRVHENRSEQTVHPGLPPSTVLLCKDGPALVGIVEIRHRLTDFQLQFAGHIGFSLCRNRRTQETAAQLLSLALEECRRMNLSRILMTCSRYDAVSRAAIEANGGSLENETAYEGEIRCRYWIIIPASLCRMLEPHELTHELFASFIRRQEVTMCRRRIGVSWHMVFCPFVDDWTDEQLRNQIHHLQTTLHGGGAVFGAFPNGLLKGFAAVSARPFGPDNMYLDLLSLHVSADWRSRGLGRMLFEHAAEWARRKGAQRLYISAHSAKETQAFYAALGCRDTQWPSPEHVALEPFDCQLEYLL